MGAAELNGITIEYDDVGRGEPLILVHGHPFDRSMWRPQVEHFSRAGRRVIVPDLRGYGRSAPPPGTAPPGSTTLAAFAGDIAALLDHLGIERAVIGGLSMGGQIVMEFHRRHAPRVGGLLLAATSPRADTAAVRRWRHETADRLLREGMAGYAGEVLPKMMAPESIRARPAAARHVLDMMRGTAPAGAAAALRGRAERPDYVESLARVAVPALVAVGTADEFTPVAEARLMHERIPGAALAVFEGAGHLPNLERPDEFNEALETFLSGI